MSSSGATPPIGSPAATSVPASTATTATFSQTEFQSAVQTELAKALAASLPGPSGLSAGKPIVFLMFVLASCLARVLCSPSPGLSFSFCLSLPLFWSLSLLPRHQVPAAPKACNSGVRNLSVLTSTLSLSRCRLHRLGSRVHHTGGPCSGLLGLYTHLLPGSWSDLITSVASTFPPSRLSRRSSRP